MESLNGSIELPNTIAVVDFFYILKKYHIVLQAYYFLMDILHPVTQGQSPSFIQNAIMETAPKTHKDKIYNFNIHYTLKKSPIYITTIRATTHASAINNQQIQTKITIQ